MPRSHCIRTLPTTVGLRLRLAEAAHSRQPRGTSENHNESSDANTAFSVRFFSQQKSIKKIQKVFDFSTSMNESEGQVRSVENLETATTRVPVTLRFSF